jgi:hypothetical protein
MRGRVGTVPERDQRRRHLAVAEQRGRVGQDHQPLGAGQRLTQLGVERAVDITEGQVELRSGQCRTCAHHLLAARDVNENASPFSAWRHGAGSVLDVLVDLHRVDRIDIVHVDA